MANGPKGAVKPVPPPSTTQQSSVASAPLPQAAPAVNRKKQKRRQKAAAKLVAGEDADPANFAPIDLARAALSARGSALAPKSGPFAHQVQEDDDQDDFDDDNSNSAGQSSYPNGYADNAAGANGARKKPKKKKKNKGPASADDQISETGPHPGPPVHRTTSSNAIIEERDTLWNSDSKREQIKEFWQSLSEDERKSLVKIEKDAVIKTMKEQQKHSCSCTVCGRKRTAIEEELEVLYDAYYNELEEYESFHAGLANSGLIPYSRNSDQPANRSPLLNMPPPLAPPHSSRPPPHLPPLENQNSDDAYEDDEDFEDDDLSEESDEDYDEFYEDPMAQEDVQEITQSLFNFGNSLQVKGIRIQSPVDPR
jgi:Salt tolerance down-regulator